MTITDLIPLSLQAQMPRLYQQEQSADPIVWAKLFTPDAGWTWYLLEWDGSDRCFGWVVGFEQELGYFSLHELVTVRGPLGLPIERDRAFRPTPLSQVKARHQR